MNWKGEKLTGDQTGHPILWHKTITELGYDVPIPELTPEWFVSLWGDAKKTPRLKTFGHRNPKDKTSPHFLCTRGGYVFHTDPGFTRYALQIQLYNEGYVVGGFEDRINFLPLFKPGLAILLDTWSPHQVVRDPRLPNTGPNKLLVGADYKVLPDIGTELPELIKHISTLLDNVV